MGANMKKNAKRKTAAPHPPMGDAQLQAVAGLFSTLCEVSRLRILQALERSPASVTEIIEQTGLKQANVSKQLGILLSAGVIARKQDGNRAIYSIAMPVIFELCDLVCSKVASRAKEYADSLTLR
jgi:DNA-binding transcriptional ArsR family regulator